MRDNRETRRQVLRLSSGALLLGPGLNRFLTYESSIQVFTGLGLPEPALLVILVGITEVAAAALLFADRAVPLAALLAAPVMLVAAATAGPSVANIAVLGAVLALAGLEVEGIETDEVKGWTP